MKKEIRKITSLSNTLSVDWTVANVCNYDCHYCSADANGGDWMWPDLDLVDQTLKELRNHYKDRRFLYTLLGGELTLWKKFSDFITLLEDITPDCGIKLLTNGKMPPSYWEREGHRYSAVQFSYHGRQTNTDEFIASVKACTCKNINVFVMMDLLHWGKCQEAYYKIVNECDNVRIIQAKPVDNRATNYNTSLVTYTQMQIDWMKSAKHLNRNISVLPFQHTYAEYTDGSVGEIDPMQLILEGKNQWQGWHCNIGVEKIALRFDGEITRASGCDVSRKTEIGNWRNAKIIELPVAPVICPKEACFCGNDIGVSRYPS